MSTQKQFTGFPPEGIQFLRDLSENNNKGWFEKNKQTYTDAVKNPALALVADLGEQLAAAFPPISYDTRTNGGSMMRIYRDTRFSADKSPYKTNVAMMFTPRGYKRMEAPGFGLQITPEQVDLVTGMFEFNKAQLVLYREAVDRDESGQALEIAIQNVLSKGAYRLGEQDLKRVPRDYDANHPHAELLKYKGLSVFSPSITLDIVHSDEFIDAMMIHFRNMSPIWQWLMEALNLN